MVHNQQRTIIPLAPVVIPCALLWCCLPQDTTMRTVLLHTCLCLLIAAVVDAKTSNAYKRVSLDLFVMSKCPDAVYCESALAEVMEELHELVALNMHFIGEKQDDGSWKCKHGESECNGDIQQLCVQLNSNIDKRYDWLYKFALCNNKEGMDSIGTFTTAAKCLKEASVPFADGTKMLACMYAPGHEGVLAADFAQTAALGVSTSCTIQVEGNSICVRDGGEWKDCAAGSGAEDFKSVICAAYAAKNNGYMPAVCTPSERVTVS